MANTKSIGIAYSDQAIDGGTIDNTVIGGTTAAAGSFTNLTVTGNSAIGNAASDTVGFYGKTPATQRAAAAQGTSTVGTASSADVTTEVKAALIEVMNTLTALGLWKGSA